MRAERVLAVDDDPEMLRTIERLLAPRYAVARASSFDEASRFVREWSPDLVILDIVMPERDGFEVLTRLRELQPDVDAIFMTGEIHRLDTFLIRSIREKAFYFIQKPFDREVFLTLVERCLELRRLGAENREYLALLEAELEEARSFQRGLLPPMSGDVGGAAVRARYLPCLALGGDFVDWVDAGNGRLALAVGDVSGHGVSAAMLTAVVKSAFHAAHVDGYAPRSVVRRVARGIQAFGAERFVTLFAARIATKELELELEYVNAGHPPAILWSVARPLTDLLKTGPLVSPVLGEDEWSEARLALRQGDHLLVYTDGVTETRGEQGLFGEGRLRDVIARSKTGGDELLDRVIAAAREFSRGRPQDDDQTLATVTVP